MLAATVLAAFSTVAVGFIAHRASAKAAKVANASEAARAASEAERAALEERAREEDRAVARQAAHALYERSLDDALASLFRAIRVHLETNSPQAQRDRTFVQADDTFAPVLTEFEVLRLRVRDDDDLKVASTAANALMMLDGQLDRDKIIRTQEFVTALRKWRTKENAPSQTISELRRIVEE